MDGVGLGQEPQVSLDMRNFFCYIKYKLRRLKEEVMLGVKWEQTLGSYWRGNSDKADGH